MFIGATANDVSHLPPEILCKSRWSGRLFLELTNQAQCEAICEIHITKFERDPNDFDRVQLVRLSDGSTGSEVENFLSEAMYLSCTEGKGPPI